MTAGRSKPSLSPFAEEPGGAERLEPGRVATLEPLRALVDPVVTREEEDFLSLLPASSVARQTLFVRVWSATCRRR